MAGQHVCVVGPDTYYGARVRGTPEIFYSPSR